MTDKEFIRIMPVILHKFITVTMGKVVHPDYAYLSGMVLDIYFQEQKDLYIKTGRGNLIPIRSIKEIKFTKL
jgi:hypothetical protein